MVGKRHETLSKSFLDPEPQSPRHLCCTADGKSETALADSEKPSQGLVTMCLDWWSGAPSHGSRVVTTTWGWQALRGDQPFFFRQSVKSQLIQRSGKALPTSPNGCVIIISPDRLQGPHELDATKQ